jgi:TP901 family phage tail tape measure protein
MTKSFSSSALNLEGFKQSMKTVAPIAASANVSLETTTALLGTLADAGLRGTRAATGLRNLMSQLTDPTSKLAQELGYTIENSEGLIHAFKDLATRNIDLAKATGLTDKRSKAAFITLVNGIDNVQD